MRFFTTSLFILAAATSTVSAATKEYAVCTPQRAQQYFSSLSNEITSCQKSSTFDLAGGSFPTTAQRDAVCKCTTLIKQLPNIRVPRCKLSLDGNPYKFKDAIESIFADCSGVRVLEEPLPASQAGSKAVDETGADADADVAVAPTTKPIATAAPAKNNSTSSGSGGSSSDIIETPKPKEETKAPKTTKPPVTSVVPTPTPKSAGVSTTTALSAMAAVTTAVAVLLA